MAQHIRRPTRDHKHRSTMPPTASHAPTSAAATRRRWYLAALAVIIFGIASRACDDTAVSAPQQITNNTAGLSYVVGGSWLLARVDLPFGPGPPWSGVAQLGSYSCGGEPLDRGLVGSSTYTRRARADTALTVAAGSLIANVIGASPPSQLPLTSTASLGSLPARHLHLSLAPTRPSCPALTTTLDLYAIPPIGNRTAVWSLFFLITDHTAGSSKPAPLTPTEQHGILDSVRLTPN